MDGSPEDTKRLLKQRPKGVLMLLQFLGCSQVMEQTWHCDRRRLLETTLILAVVSVVKGKREKKKKWDKLFNLI